MFGVRRCGPRVALNDDYLKITMSQVTVIIKVLIVLCLSIYIQLQRSITGSTGDWKREI